MATERMGVEEDSRMAKWVKKRIPKKICDLFPREKSHRQVYFVEGLRFSSLISEYVFTILITFLTEVWKLKLIMAVLITNLQEGITSILKIFVAYVADAHLGYFAMLFGATCYYCFGLGLLSYSYPYFSTEEINACTANNECASKPLTWSFFLALILIIMGKSGTELSMDKFDPRKDENNLVEERTNETREGRLSCVSWVVSIGEKVFVRENRGVCISWVVVIAAGCFIGAFVFPYIPLEWEFELKICAILMAGYLFIYLIGIIFYPPDKPKGSPLSCVPRVLVAAMRNKDRTYMNENTTLFYNGDANDDGHPPSARPNNVGILRCLNKAAIIESYTSNDSSPAVKQWKLCTVQEVEDAKILLRMVPMSLTFLMYGIVRSIGNTFFLEQGSYMNSRLGSIKKFPLQAFVLLSDVVGYATSEIYDMAVRKWKPISNKRILDALKISLGMAMSVCCCMMAWAVEKHRLETIKENHLSDESNYTVPMSVFWLTPQFVALGAMNGLARNGIEGFFGHQVPRSFERYGVALAECVTGVGTISSLGLIFIIRKATKKGDHFGWFADSIDESRLDYFYLTLSIVGFVNFWIYFIVSMKYSYKQDDHDQEESEEEI